MKTFKQYLASFVGATLTNQVAVVENKESQKGNRYEELTLHARDEFGRGVKLPLVRGYKALTAKTRLDNMNCSTLNISDVREDSTCVLGNSDKEFTPKKITNVGIHLVLEKEDGQSVNYRYLNGVVKRIGYNPTQSVFGENGKFNEVLRNQDKIKKLPAGPKRDAWLLEQDKVKELIEIAKEMTLINKGNDILFSNKTKSVPTESTQVFDATKRHNKVIEGDVFEMSVGCANRVITGAMSSYDVDFYSKTIILSEIFGKEVVDCAISRNFGRQDELNRYVDAANFNDDFRESFNDGVDTNLEENMYDNFCNNIRGGKSNLLFSGEKKEALNTYVVNGIRLPSKANQTVIWKGESFYLTQAVKDLCLTEATCNLNDLERNQVLDVFAGEEVKEVIEIPEEVYVEAAEPSGTNMEAALNAELAKLIG